MKLIDKYLMNTFLLPLAYCLAAFILVYVIYDLFDNLPDFVQAQTPILEVCKFYMMLMPSVLIFIVPVSLMLATLYSLSNLTKNNELTAMRASGVSLYRLVTPFMLSGLVASGLVAVIHETIGPWSNYWSNQFVRAQRHKGTLQVYIAHNLPYMNDRENRLWFVSEFDTRTYSMRHIDVTQRRPEGTDLRKVQARRAEWLDGKWWFMDLAIQDFNERGYPSGPARFERRREMLDLNETPQDFLDETKEPEYLSSSALLKFLREHADLSKDTIARYTVDLHHRLAIPWTCLIVTLLGIPFGAQTGRRGAFLGVSLSLGLFFGFWILVNVGLALGKKQMMIPWLAAWGPNILFLIVGAVLIHRMR